MFMICARVYFSIKVTTVLCLTALLYKDGNFCRVDLLVETLKILLAIVFPSRHIS